MHSKQWTQQKPVRVFNGKILCLQHLQPRKYRKWQGQDQRQTKLQALIPSHSSLLLLFQFGCKHRMLLEVAKGKGTLSESKGRKETGKKPWWVWWLCLLDGSDSHWLRAYWEHSNCRHILHCPLQTVGISKACFILKSIILANTTKQHHFPWQCRHKELWIESHLWWGTSTLLIPPSLALIFRHRLDSVCGEVLTTFFTWTHCVAMPRRVSPTRLTSAVTENKEVVPACSYFFSIVTVIQVLETSLTKVHFAIW